jgi:hypothetical protein
MLSGTVSTSFVILSATGIREAGSGEVESLP